MRRIQLAGNETGRENATRIPTTAKLIMTKVEIRKRRLAG